MALRMGYSVVAFHVDRSELYTPEFSKWHTVKRRIETEHYMLAREVVRMSYDIGSELGVGMEVVMSGGEPASEILAYAGENGVVKLIAMSNGALTGTTERLIDGVIKTVILQQNKPVLVSSNPMTINSILVVIEDVDDTGGSYGAMVKHAGMLARALRARVGIMSLVPDLLAIAVDYGHISEVPYMKARKSFRRFENIYRQRTRAIVSEATQLIAAIDATIPVTAKETDEAGEVIAEAHNYGLIVIRPKQKAADNTLTDISKTLLNSRSLSTLFVP